MSEPLVATHMRSHVQKKFLEDMIGCTDALKVLIMDDAATRIISSALTMYDIMERNVTIVEQLSKNRQAFTDLEAIYFISTDPESIKHVLDDFKTPLKAKYRHVHMFFCDPVCKCNTSAFSE